MREGYWVIRTYEAGEIGEKSKYFIPGAKPPKSEWKMKSDLAKQKANDTNATKKLARSINANFKAGDGFICLTYGDKSYAEIFGDLEALPEEERLDEIMRLAKLECTNFTRRLKYACKKQGIECKYITVTSDMDGKTGETVRIHHHVIVPAELVDLAAEKWKHGMVKKRTVWKEKDHIGLAKYLMDQVRRIPDEKKYTPSRNLIIPKPVDRLAKSGSEVQPPKGAILLHRQEFRNGEPQYIRYIIPEKKTPGKKHTYTQGGNDDGNLHGNGTGR